MMVMVCVYIYADGNVSVMVWWEGLLLTRRDCLACIIITPEGVGGGGLLLTRRLPDLYHSQTTPC